MTGGEYVQGGICPFTKLIMSKCLPMLLYGVAASEAQSKEISKSSFAFNSIFFKLFGAKTKSEIALIQHHCNILDYPRLQNYHRITFLNKLFLNSKIRNSNPFDKADFDELNSLNTLYNTKIGADKFTVKNNIWTDFTNMINTFKKCSAVTIKQVIFSLV